ncbi:uncharacterized protein LOC125139265 [Tachysurus ichikawai]
MGLNCHVHRRGGASAVPKLIGGKSIVSAALMNKAVVMFVNEIHKAELVHKKATQKVKKKKRKQLGQKQNRWRQEKKILKLMTIQNRILYRGGRKSVATDNTDLITADAGFTVVRSKRKSKVSSSGPQTRKKGLVETGQEKQIINNQEAVMESSREQDTNTDTDSDEAKHNKEQAGTYTAKDIKRFLQKTKNMKGVKVDQHFPDRQSFVDSTIIRDKNKSFTHQEVYRLKKLVTRTRQDLLGDEEESA